MSAVRAVVAGHTLGNVLSQFTDDLLIGHLTHALPLLRAGRSLFD